MHDPLKVAVLLGKMGKLQHQLKIGIQLHRSAVLATRTYPCDLADVQSWIVGL